jgi:predicted 3-demethylubiquinone-9 3-methyltransferase (glyoxalase superfamily)
MSSKNTICLWYDGDALDAATFYAKTFPTAPSAPYSAHLATIPMASRAMS